MSKKTALQGGVIGVILGVVLGVLFAPKSGKETRTDIKNAAVKANKAAEKRLKKMYGELNSRAKDIKSQADSATGKAKRELNALGRRADFALKQVSELITAVREFEASDEEVEKALGEGQEVLDEIKDAKDK